MQGDENVQRIRGELREHLTLLKGDLKEAVKAEARSVAERLSPEYQARQRPLIAAGTALGAGALLGLWVGSRALPPGRSSPDGARARLGNLGGTLFTLALRGLAAWMAHAGTEGSKVELVFRRGPP